MTPRQLVKSPTELQTQKPKPPTSGRFRSACTVMLDTIANKTYDFEVSGLKERAAIARENYPNFSKCTEFVTRYGYGFGLAFAQRQLSKVTGSTISYGVVYTQPFLVSTLVHYLRHVHHTYPIHYARHKHDAGDGPSVHDDSDRHKPSSHKQFSNKPFKIFSKPSLAVYSGTFAILELVSIPAYVFILDKMVHAISDGIVHPLTAAVSVVTANLAATVIEYLGFRHIWKKKVLGEQDIVMTGGTRMRMPEGTLTDEIRGVLSEFKPFKAFSLKLKREHNPAKTASEYIGQIYSVLETHYFWLQIIRPLFAAGFALVCSVDETVFVDLLFSAMAACGFGLISGGILANYQFDIVRKIEENNKALGLDGT